MTLGYSKAFNELAKPGFDPAAAEAALRRERDQESIAKQQAHQRQLSGDAEHTGETAKAVGALRQNAEDAAKADEKERKERTDRAMLLQALDQHIAEIDFQLEVGASFAEDLANGVAPELDDEGRIADEDREAFIRAYEERTGERVDRTDIEALREAVDAQNAYLRQTRETASNLRAEIDRSDPDASYSQGGGAALGEQVEAFIEQHQLQASGLAAETPELDHVQEFDSLESEIEHFMQELARAQSIEGEDARLIAERELVSGLSEGASDIISMGEDTEHLFEEEYFARLDAIEPEVDGPSGGVDAASRPISPI